jgi:endoglucanase
LTPDDPHAGPASGPRGAFTRRRLLAAGTLGAAAVLAGARAGGGGLPVPEPLAVAPEPGAARGFRRGINSYTLIYASADSGAVGEPALSYAFLAARGHRIVRLPFEWGRLQPRLGGALDPGYVDAIDRETAAIAQAGMQVILDVHSSARHPATRSTGRRFGQGISAADFVDLWLRLSERFGGDPRIYAYDLMNEPYEIPDGIWQEYSQSVVHALRAHGDRTLLWIEGNEYSLASVWREHQPVAWIEDPLDRHMYSAHTYPGNAALDAQPAPSAPDQTAFLSDLRTFVGWLEEFGVRGSVGEVGWPSQRHVGRDGARAWNQLGGAWFQMVDRAGLDVTYFGASSAYDNWLWAYDAPRNGMEVPGMSIAESQAAVIEAHPSRIVGQPG